MNNRKRLKPRHKLLMGLFLGVMLLCLTPTMALPQVPSQRPVSSHLTQVCRKVNRDATNGLIAYQAPGREEMKTAEREIDGPEANAAVYLTSSPPEVSADGNYVRVWFKSLDPNYKQGWVARRFNNDFTNTRDDSLKMGSNQWRALNCFE